MSEFQRNIFQKKLKEAESALGFDFSEGAEETPETSNAPSPKPKSTTNAKQSTREEYVYPLFLLIGICTNSQ